MTRLRLIRHAHAARAAEGDHDPGLDVVGARQAIALPPRFGGDQPQRLIVSPLRRARETALPLAAAFGLERDVNETYGELPWRGTQTVIERSDDLRSILARTWSEAPPEHRLWRDTLVRTALAETGDAMIVTHFVAINALVGMALHDDRVVVFRPANASVTELTVRDGALGVVSTGAEDPGFALT